MAGQTIPGLFSLTDLGFSTLSVLALCFLAIALSSFVKIVTVLGIVRIGMGVRSLPSVFVTGSLALVLSFLVMYPTLRDSAGAADSVLKGQSGPVDADTRTKALEKAFGVWKGFLEKHTHQDQIDAFASIAKRLDEKSEQDQVLVNNSWRVLAPAFLVSELKEAFATGLTLFLPFLVLDLFIANILVAVGLQRMSPAFVSFPFKLLLFVLVDGWALITTNVVSTYVP